VKATLELGLTGPNLIAIFRRLQEVFLPNVGLPSSLYVDGKKKVTPDWLEKWSAQTPDFLRAVWDKVGWIRLDPGTIVKISLENYDIDSRPLLDLLSGVPFTVCSAATIHPEWMSGTLAEKYLAPSFGDMHWRHGWGCLFRGEGHKRLVSRRWLDFGPWRLLRGECDTSLVQFHDLAADAATALIQARPGHERMGISDVGGYIQTNFHYSQDLKGMYYASERKLHIVVPSGGEVTQREMLDPCAARLYQALGADKPVDNVVYVFVEEGPARACLHELWLRDLECRTFIEGIEVNLTTDYHPAPEKPEWVAKLKEQTRAVRPAAGT
jgi:hypothetical protein